MAVYQRKFYQDATSLPLEGANSSYTVSTTVAAGPLEFLRIRIQQNYAVEAHQDPLNFISRIALVVDGTRYHDIIANYDASADATPGPVSMAVRDMGGRAWSVPAANTATSYEMFLDIPIGIQLGANNTVSRFEMEINYFASGLTPSTGVMEVYGIYNDEYQTSVCFPQSQTHISSSNSNELISVRIGEGWRNQGYVVAGLVVENDESGGMDLNNFRLPLVGQFDVTTAQALSMSGRYVPGEPGYWYTATAATAPQAQTRSDGLDTGHLFLPCFGAQPSSGAIELLLESDGTHTYRITPVLVKAGVAGAIVPERQTASTKTNAESEILRGATA